MTNQPQARGDWVEEMVERYAGMVFRVAFTHTKNRADAEDVFQEVFMRLFRCSAAFGSEEHIKAWLIRVTVNISRNLLHSAWHRKRAVLHEDLQYEKAIQDSGVVEMVKSLPLKYRTVIHLFYFEELPVSEIAKVIRVKQNTVKSQLSRARKLLKKKMEGGGLEDVQGGI